MPQEVPSTPATPFAAPTPAQPPAPAPAAGPAPEAAPAHNALLARFQPVSTSEKLFFTRQLGVMIRAGISLAGALKMLAQQTSNARLATALEDIQAHIEKGDTLAQGLKKYPGIFDELFVSMIEVGEAGGMLEDVLKQLHLQLKKQHQLKSKIRSALAYPAMVMLAMSVIGTGVVVFIVPRFISIFQEVELELPLATRLLIMVSDAIQAHGLLVALAVVTAIAALIYLIRLPQGKYWFDWLLLRLPIIGTIVRKINLARFARIMSALLTTDIKIVESFTITAKTLGNVHYRHALEDAAERVVKGNEIHEILGNYPLLFNGVVLQMIRVGEESGEIDTVLGEVAQFYEEEVTEVMDTLPSLIEPIIIVILAVAIGGMAIAIIMPMYQLTNAF